MKENLLISVIVPVYCTAQFLPACIDSLIAQTYRNIEILLVDDGSTDQSGAICDAYASRDARVRVIHQANGGVSRARNAGLAQARGSYVSFVDSDDTLEPDTYAYLIGQMQLHGADAAMFEYSIDHRDHTITHTHRGYPSVMNAEQAVCACVTPVNRFACTKLFCARLTEQMRFDPEISVGEDTLFCVQALKAAKCVYFSHRVLYHYRQHGQSVTNRGFGRENLSAVQAYRAIASLCCDISKKAENAALDALAHFYADTLHGLRRADFDADRTLYRAYRKQAFACLGRILWVWGISLRAKIKLALCCLFPCTYDFLKRIRRRV